MDNTILLIVIGSTVVFVGVVIWKIWWLLKKTKVPEQAPSERE